MPRTSLSMFPQHLYTQDRLLLAIAIGHNMTLSGVVSLGHVIPSLTFNSPAPRSSPDASVSKYSGSFSLQNFKHASFFLKFFAFL